MRRLWTEGFHVHLQLLGFFEEQYRQEVDRLVADGMTEFYGFQKEPLPFYQNCDCVVLPSYHEGMSNVLLEAAAVGRPIIASDIPGCREAVEHSKTGLLCRAKDADSLYVAMRAFWRFPQSKKQPWAKRPPQMEREFNKASVVAETLRIVTAEKAAPQPGASRHRGEPMSGYIWMLLWLLIYTALSAVLEVQQSETVCGVQTVRFTKLWAALGVLPLLIFCTLRGDIGDTYNYMHAFSEMPSTSARCPLTFQSLQKDHGFFLLSALIKLLCGGQVRVWFCILAALQLWPLVKN